MSKEIDWREYVDMESGMFKDCTSEEVAWKLNPVTKQSIELRVHLDERLDTIEGKIDQLLARNPFHIGEGI